MALSATLPPITEKQAQWAYANGGHKMAFKCKSVIWCNMCGGVSEYRESDLGCTVLGSKVRCPHCGARLKVQVSRKTKYREKFYFTILTTCKGYQVCRNYSVDKYICKGEEPYYGITEVVQNWISEDGHEEIIARPASTIGWCFDNWCYNKPLEIRDTYRSNNIDKYHIQGSWVYPVRRLLPTVKRNGYTGRCDRLPESDLIKLLLTDKEAEMLIKNGQFGLIEYKWARGYPEYGMPYGHAIRIANRNRYIVKDASMWFDYLKMLDELGLDTHNAHYVCPKELATEHDRMLARKRRRDPKWHEEQARRRKEAEQSRKEAAEWEERYRAAKSRYFDICFGNKHITIRVIQSVAEMADEGNEMHHCVFDSAYYKKPDSLIMTARDKRGKRLETVEISLKTYKVIQSRAKFNKHSKRHKEIIKLVEKNMHLIRQVS